MKRSIGILAFAVLACKTGGDVAQVKDTQVLPFEGELGMKPGVGFETVFEDVRGTCVDFDGAEAPGNAQTATFNVEIIENHKDLGVALNVSNASSVKAAIPDTPATVSAKTKFMLGASYALNRYSIFILAKAQVRNETKQLTNARLNDAIKTELGSATLTDDRVDQLRLRCGDSFMSGYTTGGEFFGVLELQTDSEEQKVEMKREVELALQATDQFEVNSQQSFEFKLTNAVKNKKLKIWTYQKGGSGSAQVGLVDSPEALMTRIKQFPDFVTNTTNAAAYTATFKDYFTLDVPLPAAYRAAVMSAQDVMAELAGIQTQLIDRRGDIDYILSHTNSFVGVDTPKQNALRQAKTRTNDMMKKIYAAARACHSKFRDCKKPDDIVVEALELPVRKPTIAALTSAGITLKTKFQALDVEGVADGLWNPGECYVEVRVKGGGKTKRLRRTPTTYDKPRCNNLTHTFDLPLALLTETMKGMGISEDEGEIEVLVIEDDPGDADEVLGSKSKKIKEISAGSAALDTLTGKSGLTVPLEYEVH